jgi:hypothetical protein
MRFPAEARWGECLPAFVSICQTRLLYAQLLLSKLTLLALLRPERNK